MNSEPNPAFTDGGARRRTHHRDLRPAVAQMLRGDLHAGQQHWHGDPHVLLDTTERDYQRVLDVNLKSAFLGTQLAAK